MPQIKSDTRLTELTQWANQKIGSERPLVSLGGDAGFRRYFRFAPPLDLLGVDAPPTTEDTAQFLRVAELLQQHKVKVPKINAADVQQGFLLVEDLGDDLVYRQINNQNADLIYQQAMDLISGMQTIASRPDWLPVYDQTFLMQEMHLMSEWFIEKLLRYTLSTTEKKLINTSLQKLSISAAEQPQGFVHRDFHSRNLLITRDSLATIDFQGALWGPITYDLASLLRDCYLHWPQEKIIRWAMQYHKKIEPHYPNLSSIEFLKCFDWMGLQRHIKVLGIFARLHLRDNKQHYLQDLPLVIRYTLEICDQYAELQLLSEWFREKLIPLAAKKSWYSDYQTAGDRS